MTDIEKALNYYRAAEEDTRPEYVPTRILLPDLVHGDGPFWRTAAEAGEHLLYTRSEADALGRVARGEAVGAFLVRPTRLEQMLAVAASMELMPQKSTYFYPKLLTGFVFYPMED